MSAKNILLHLFFPHHTNNQKAKILHSSSLFVITFFLVGFQLLLNYIPRTFPQVLGYAANISVSEIIRETNEHRAQAGLPALTQNSTLSQAALAKGNDMLAKGYWAHFAPDGTSPWSFFLSFGYKYRYAGENLARDFSSAHLAVDGWMASPSHRDNILSKNYQDIGVGVVEGKLSGADTTIIVQFFGAPLSSAPSIPVAKAVVSAPTSTPAPVVAGNAQILEQTIPIPDKIIEETPVATPTPEPTTEPTPEPTQTPVAVITSTDTGIGSRVSSLISPFKSTKNLSIAIVSILLLVLAVDLIIVKYKKISRISGRTMAHMGFFAMIFAVIIILKAGRII